jgi:chromosome segregation ATPase
MSWTNDDQTRLNRLRNKELAGTLTAGEQAELASLMGQVEAEEAQALAPEMNRLRAEIGDVQHELAKLAGGNEELARLMGQQQALVADARSFLAEFDRRRASILDGLARIVGGPLPTS